MVGAGNMVFQIDENFTRGTYLVKVAYPGGVYTEKLVVE